MRLIWLSRRGAALLVLLCSIWLCQGCVYQGVPRPVYFPGALAPLDFRFRDGGEAIFFVIDKSLDLEPRTEPRRDIQTFLFVISGSDCTSMQYFLPQYFRGLEGESGPLRIFILHKRHIAARTWGRNWGCSEQFIRDDHPSRWIADQTEFIRAQLERARSRSLVPRRIVIAGISEGAEIVPTLARGIPAITHAVIVANGGMDPLDAYRLQAQRQGFGAALQALGRLDDPAPLDPDVPDHGISGRTWRYWHELLQLHYADGLLALRIPLLAGMGEADQAVPIDSAWELQQRFARAGKSNLTLLTFPGADHALQTEDRNRMPDFWHEVDLWLRH